MMEARLVVKKPLVRVEQIIGRKQQVVDQRTVDVASRKERLEIDDATTRAASAVHDTTSSTRKSSAERSAYPWPRST